MEPFLDTLILPVVEQLAPSRVLEIGCDEGAMTIPLLEWCRKSGAHLDVIDPAPRFEAKVRDKRLLSSVTIHRDLSVNVLPTIEHPGLALIDGDHNYYTVKSELEILAGMENMEFPLCFLHDTGWPYGYRDGYYDPQNIPAEHLQPNRQGGVIPGEDRLIEAGGLNSKIFHAVVSGGPRNGLRAAIEHFLQESGLGLSRMDIPCFNGLTILAHSAHLEGSKTLKHLFEDPTGWFWQSRLLEKIEVERNRLLLQVFDSDRRSKAPLRRIAMKMRRWLSSTRH